MAEFPFKLVVNRPFSKQKESLTCTSLLREVPGRRRVYEALWDSRSVIVKLFSHRTSAKRHLKREWRGLSLLQAKGLNAPKPLFTAQTEDGQWVAVLQKISNSTTLLQAFGAATDESGKAELLTRLCRELAREHSRAVAQKDLHLGNFLLAEGRVFALDAGQMRFLRHRLGRKASIRQLAMLACSLPEASEESLDKLCQQYAQARGWHFGKSDQRLFGRQLAAQKRKIIRKSLKKCLRTSKRFLRVKKDQCLAVFDRDFCHQAEPLDLIEQIDALMDKGQVLKNGNTCYVSRIKWNGKDIVVKRYNNKGFVHSLRHTIKNSRARRGWLNAHLLRMLKIPGPTPLTFIEKRKTAVVWKSYLVTEYVPGQKLYDFLRAGRPGDRQRSEITAQVAELLGKLGQNHISHGDLKHSNILITEAGPVLTDLDAMTAHKFSPAYKIMRVRDIKRIRRDWPELQAFKIS